MVFFMSLLHIGNQSWKRTNSKWELRHWKSTWLLFKANAMRNTLILIRLLSLSYILEKNISFKLDFSHFSSLEKCLCEVYTNFVPFFEKTKEIGMKVIWNKRQTGVIEHPRLANPHRQHCRNGHVNIVTMVMSAHCCSMSLLHAGCVVSMNTLLKQFHTNICKLSYLRTSTGKFTRQLIFLNFYCSQIVSYFCQKCKKMGVNFISEIKHVEN